MQTDKSLSELLNAKHSEYRYLLLDPLKGVASWKFLHLTHLTEICGNEALRRVLRPDLAYSPEHCPVLLLLASPGAGCDEAIVLESEAFSRDERLCERRYICGWISSPLAPDALAAELAGLCKQIKREAIVPFYEPLRLELLQTLGEAEELSSLLSPVSQWWRISCSGHLTALSGKSGGEEWRLRWGAERAQNEVRNIWRLVYAWQKTQETLPPDAALQAADALARSATAKFHHTGDQLCLALSYLTFPLHIIEQPDVQSLLRQVASDPNLHFTQLFPSLPNAVWQRLIQP
ncbi:hypothetical protein GE278_22460 (plasmid) [Enterobacteriaceae bacterium Kacie_13]|nr:hypothetical protein GE278_22460 [Enterobacteriaceae bacterium Kacie_13]